MKRATAMCVIFGILCAQSAAAMILNPRGTGQVLLFPYFTVNRHQQTLINVANLTPAAKVAKVRFREAYDGRELLDFKVFLPAHSTWISVLFSLDDAGISGAGAGLGLNDSLCTLPAFDSAHQLPSGHLYQPLLNYGYTGSYGDTGPSDDLRTREGWFEVVEMAELTGATRAAITPIEDLGVPESIPPGCAALLTTDIPQTDLLPPRGGLQGSEAIVDVPLGTFYAAGATALDGVYNRSMYTTSDGPDLRDANVAASGFVTADVPLNGSFVVLNYPPERAIDAASAVLAASEIVTKFEASDTTGVQNDWVVTFPTKHFYVDPEIVGKGSPAIAPFSERFGAAVAAAGHSDVDATLQIFDRSGTPLFTFPDILPRPPAAHPPVLPYETQVIVFTPAGQPPPSVSPVLGAAHPVAVETSGSIGTTTAHLSFNDYSAYAPQIQRASREGQHVRGLPVIGFEAINYVNANATPGVLANYSAALPLRSLAPCIVDASGAVVGPCP